MKSPTDQHWNARAESVKDDREVNIMDVFQRELEYAAILPLLKKDVRLLEVGCGNGYSTARFREAVTHVDAFDYSEQMIERAKAGPGETNNRFFVDNLLSPASISSTYDAVLCVRVLINLKNLDEQKVGLKNLQTWVKPGGCLILVEGYTDGFEELSALRLRLGLPKVAPAPINFYSALADIQSAVSPGFHLESTFHLGGYDFLTRVVYPSVVGQENVVPNSHFAEKASEIAREFNPDAMKAFSRIQGLVFRRAL